MRGSQDDDVPEPRPQLGAADGGASLPAPDSKNGTSALLSLDGRVLRLDDNYPAIMGESPSRDDDWTRSLPVELREPVRQMFDELAGREVSDRILPVLDPDLRWLRIRLRRRPEPDGRLVVLAQFDDLTTPARSSLVAQVIRDPLTGAYNRRAFLELAALPPDITNRYASVLAVDVRRFRGVNEVWGRAVGDACLVEVAQWLDGLCSPGDILVRRADAEFIVLLDRSSGLPAALEQDSQRTVTVAGHAIQLSLQAGLATGGTIEQLAERAEVALVAAKRSAWRTVVPWTEAIAERAARTARYEEAVQQAVAAGQEMVYFQPIVDVVTQRVIDVEALVRLGGPAGQVPTDEILQASHRLGLTPVFAERIYDRAFAEGLRLRSVFPRCLLGINVSREFLSTGLGVDTVLRSAARYDVPPSQITLELTEDVAAGLSTDLLQAELGKGAAAGLHIVIDDFGRGETSLSLLRKLPLSAIKLDRSLLPTDLTDEHAWEFVEGIVTLLSRITRRLVVEGVESAEQSYRLRQLGLYLQQGYYFGAPAPVEHWLSNPVIFPG